MSFRPLKFIQPVFAGGREIFLPEVREKVTNKKVGSQVFEVKSASVDLVSQSKKLPPLESTRLDVVLKSGVKLEKVNTKMVESPDIEENVIREINESIRKGEKKQREERLKELEQINKQEQTKTSEVENA